MTTHEAFTELLSAYALDVLDAADRPAVEAHLAACAECRHELESLKRVAAALGAAVEPVAPPASLKARVLAHATAQPQPRVTAQVPLPVQVERPGRPSRSWLPLAAAAILAVGLGVYAMSLRAEVGRLRGLVVEASSRAEVLRAEVELLRRDSTQLTNTVAVLSAPSLLRVDLHGQLHAQAASGRAYMSPAGGLVFSANQLPVLPSGMVYQLWVIAPGRPPISAGVFSVDAAGASMLTLPVPASPAPIGTVAVTVEPGPSGSPGPTSAVILAGSVTES